MLLMHKSARAYVTTGFGLITLASLATIFSAIRAAEADFWVAHTLKVESVATSLLNCLQHSELGQRGFLMTGNDRYLAQVNEAYGDVSSTLSQLRQLAIDNPQQLAALNDVQPVIDARLARVRTTMSLAQQGRRQEALAIVSSGPGSDLMDQIQAKIDAFREREQALLTQRQAKGATLRVWLLILIFSSLAGAIGLAATFAREAQRGINQLRRRTAELEAESKLRRETEDKLRHAQKLESIGQLTGGIAHDFNNLLTIILGNLDTLRRRLLNPLPEQSREERDAVLLKPIDYALQGTRSAALLTHRLLAFARQQPLEPARLDANDLISGLTELLRRTLGETIKLESVLAIMAILRGRQPG